MKTRWLFLRLVPIIISIIFTILCWIVIGFYKDYQNIPRDHRIGNRPLSVLALKEEGFPFSFLVIGDTSGRETAESLIERASEKGKSSFMVILGDFVKEPDIWKHRFFLTEMAVEMNPPFPVFLVSGNHDIDFNSKIREQKRRVTPEIYESFYGMGNFDFIFNQCLFIICGIDLKTPSRYLNFLQDTLRREGKGKRHIFVFIHTPPKGLADYIEPSLPEEEKFFSVLESFPGTTCFFGDHHGYWRGQRKGVHLIVSGGGGRLKKSQPEWGKFHHILRITVDQDKISEEIITIPKEMGWEDRFEEQVFTHLFPALRHPIWELYSVLVILLMASGFLSYKFLKNVLKG